MKTKIFASALVMLGTLFSLGYFVNSNSSQTVTVRSINQIYVFGDSLSDVGNAVEANGGRTIEPYYKGRVSNGPVWVDYLASKINNRLKVTPSIIQGNNYAFSGAQTGARRFPPGPPGVLFQVQQFLQTTPQADPQALYIIWAGANDYLSGTATNSTIPVRNLSTAIDSLYAAGARRFLVANLPDLGLLPATRSEANSRTLSQLSDQHNAALSQTLTQLSRKPGIQIVPLDVNTEFREAIARPQAVGFTNSRDRCWTTRVCTQPDRYLFWDGIHPTTAAHRMLADAAFESLATTPKTSQTNVQETFVLTFAAD